MKIGILEIIAWQTTTIKEYINHSMFFKQGASLTPQAISVWCRQMGHQVFYHTYYGLGDPKSKLPNDLDLIFICSHTQMAPLAYALSILYRREGTRTVIGGPHAKGFPQDCLRYFDLVVLECDRALIVDIIHDQFDPESIISSQKPYKDVPTIEERLPEIRIASFFRGRPSPLSIIPILASIGCPYSCNFCVDSKTPYQPLSTDRLIADLQYAAQHLPGTSLLFLDPNFAIRFDETLAAFEHVPPEQRNPYFVESSLSTLRPERLRRLRDTNCVAIAPGIESWGEYSNKAGVGKAVNQSKLNQVVEHFQVLKAYVPNLKANFILGLDHDVGDEPFELTREFILKVPFVWPTLNAPLPYGGTPLYDRLLQEGRVLKTMPFTFYRSPSLAIIMKNYDPILYLQKMIELHELAGSVKMAIHRFRSTETRFNLKKLAYHGGLAKFLDFPARTKFLKGILHRLQTDSQFSAFHTGETDVVPDFYASQYVRQLGKYVELLPLEKSTPVHVSSISIA